MLPYEQEDAFLGRTRAKLMKKRKRNAALLVTYFDINALPPAINLAYFFSQKYEKIFIYSRRIEGIKRYTNFKSLVDEHDHTNLFTLLKFVLKLFFVLNSEDKIFCFDKESFIVSSIIFYFRKIDIYFYHSELFANPENIFKKCLYLHLVRKFNNIFPSQDRKKLFEDCTKIRLKDELFLPVSCFYSQKKNHKIDLYKLHNIEKSKKILLHLGGIGDNYLSSELAKQLKNISDEYVAIFHCPWATSNNPIIKKKVATIIPYIDSKKIILSTLNLRIDELKALVSNCYIGLALYKDDVKNFEFITFTSSKIALFSQYKKPMICGITNDLKSDVKKYNFGCYISKLEELRKAIEYINENYNYLSSKSKDFYNVNLDEKAISHLFPCI
jgi:hypothetical protein